MLPVQAAGEPRATLHELLSTLFPLPLPLPLPLFPFPPPLPPPPCSGRSSTKASPVRSLLSGWWKTTLRPKSRGWLPTSSPTALVSVRLLHSLHDLAPHVVPLRLWGCGRKVVGSLSLSSSSQSARAATCATTWPAVAACISIAPSAPTSSAAAVANPSRRTA